MLALCHQQIAVHRANTRKVKHFICSYGNSSKTDRLDAKALARYGYERGSILGLFTPSSQQAMELRELVRRRQDLKQILVAEKNRGQSPLVNVVKTSCETMIETVSKEMDVITATINSLIEQTPDLKKKKEILKSVPGIGDIVSNELLILLPELGQIDRKQIASLAGLAPRANDSGQFSGYRATGYGRNGIKPMLFLSAMAARNSNSWLKEFYERLIARGKNKMVALTALMRKILIIANARIKEYLTKDTKETVSG